MPGVPSPASEKPGDHASDIGLSWLVTVRWTTVAAGAGIVAAGRSALDASPPWTSVAIVLSAQILLNLWLIWTLRRGVTPSTSRAGAIVCADVGLLSWLLAYSGGVLNPLSIFYVVEIVLAALVLGRTWAWIVATLSVAGYGTLYLAPSADLQSAQTMHPEIGLHVRGMWMAFAATATLVAALVARLANAIERRDRSLRLLREQSERDARLAGLATLAAGAAHELATPLGTIAVAAHELERSVERDAGAAGLRADVELIRAEIARCRRVLDDMAGRMGEPPGEAPSSLSLVELGRDAIDRIPAEHRYRVSLEAGDAIVTWPAAVLARAIANVVQNAVQASGPADRVELGLASIGDRVRVTVVDRGRGMSVAEVQRAGEPFFTTKAPGEGMGLGLFVARSAVERLGGSLTISSAPGRGSTVTMDIPRVAAQSRATP